MTAGVGVVLFIEEDAHFPHDSLAQTHDPFNGHCFFSDVYRMCASLFSIVTYSFQVGAIENPSLCCGFFIDGHGVEMVRRFSARRDKPHTVRVLCMLIRDEGLLDIRFRFESLFFFLLNF